MLCFPRGTCREWVSSLEREWLGCLWGSCIHFSVVFDVLVKSAKLTSLWSTTHRIIRIVLQRSWPSMVKVSSFQVLLLAGHVVNKEHRTETFVLFLKASFWKKSSRLPCLQTNDVRRISTRSSRHLSLLSMLNSSMNQTWRFA